MTEITPEEARVAVLRNRYQRSAVSQTAETIQATLHRETGITLDAVQRALDWLVGAGHVTQEVHSMGSTRYYIISASGQLFYEREFGGV